MLYFRESTDKWNQECSFGKYFPLLWSTLATDQKLPVLVISSFHPIVLPFCKQLNNGSTCCDRPYKMVSWCSTRKCSMLTGQEAFCWPALFSYMLTGQCCVFAICWPAMLIPMIVHFYELLFFAFFLQYDDRPISVVFQSK